MRVTGSRAGAVWTAYLRGPGGSLPAARHGGFRPARGPRAPAHVPLALSEDETVEPYSQKEHEANEKRRQEAIELNGGQEPPEFVGLNDWRWTLNFSEITPNIYVGACPRR